MKDISLLKKMTTCMIAGVVTGFGFLRIGKRFMAGWLNFQVVVVIAVAMLLTAIVYGIYWGVKKNQQHSRSSVILAFWQGMIRYGIALDLTMIGFQKIFGLQFFTPLGKLDLPFSSFSSEELVWAFFGHSRALVCIIGGFQILGSLLLLFSRTKLAGVFVLFPIMLNIVLLNFCYQMEWGESLQAVELLTGLLYLLFSEWHLLREFFFRTRSDIPSIPVKSMVFKNMIRFSILFIPLFLIWHYGSPDKHPWLTGKYRVSHVQVNRQDASAASCSDSVLTLVYFDQGNDCVFEYNNQHKRLFGTYQLNKAKNKMIVIWRYPQNIHDTLMASLSTAGRKGELTISGEMGKDTVQMALLKMP